MKKNRLEIFYLNKIIDSTIEAVEKGQKEIFNIAEHSKRECERLEKELLQVKQRAKETIERVDALEKQEKAVRFKLMMVSRDFKKYSEHDIKNAYEEARDIQIKLSLEKEREAQLREKRDDLERNYKSMMTILNQAEHLTMQVGVALSFLKGNLEDISDQLTDAAQKRNFASQIIKAQEEERRRVARDIHDGPAQTMANIIIQAEICEKLFEKDIDRAKRELKELKEIVRGSLKELRKIIFNLRPSALDDLGLEAVVRRSCSEFQEDTGINTDFKIFGDKMRMDSSIEVTLFRIIQEALSNIKKHAGAKNAVIKLETGKGLINLIIADDGSGFELNTRTDDSEMQDHFGLMSIKERTELLNGSLNIESAPGKGTKIFITIPVKGK
ncbi:sensor histidine kinase [Biomaibacter acetigenes]|uniref:histidine kinase n=1 Tax=Biomaibacter acetigenes TaxID=2316383 RepID=A0A3G2R7X7_9FIRM|nr:sensor histidine kinase [Biomaibacter acetigenes]AYO31503.1 sensor histidine kinase [Biomaibacter acetigenes]RKL62708.1 sensor histidine kinase [Thermoanaerobacteraceae bacterium SP2]